MADRELSLLTRGIGEFTKGLHLKLNKQNTNEIFSPIGIHAFLVLLSQDPSFRTKNFFQAVLHTDLNVALAHYKDIFAAFNIANDLLITNTSFIKHHKVIRDIFKNRLRDKFSSDISFLDFTELDGANEAMNAWVNERTNEKISRLSDIKDFTNLTLMNAVHFKNDWAQPFDATNTIPETFFLNGQETVQVQMMKKKGEFFYRSDPFLRAQVLKLPFAGSNVSLVIILPEDQFTVGQIYFNDLTLIATNMIKEEIDVSLPKFKMDETMQFADTLKKMGLEEVFSANMFGIIEDELLSLSEIQQRMFLEVNEKTVQAATGTLSALTKSVEEKITPKGGLKIYEANISTEISNRFAKTKVVWRVTNSNKGTADAEFKVVISETAFITGFEMEIEGNTYKSYIKEKETAKMIYNTAVAHGQSAGIVETNTRDSTEFLVSVNLEPGSVAVFSLTYEEMLQRVHDQYELVLNICPGQIVDDLNVEVRINESQPLKFVKTPPLRSGNDMRTTDFDEYLDPQSNINIVNSKTASVKFRPNPSQQAKIVHYLGKNPKEGLACQFVVQYDVEREAQNGEVLLQDGYFVHFFAPNDLDPLPKHVIFVLDTSGSMRGRKIEQLKDAMMNILGELKKEDMISIVEFNNDVVIWDVNLKKFTMLAEYMIKDFKEPFLFLQHHLLPNPQLINDSVIKKAKEVIQSITARGNTFIIGGLETALYLARTGQTIYESAKEKVQPIIIFLTDGQPNVGIGSNDLIIERVTDLNTVDKVPIFSLSFGDQADRNFLRKLSLKNLGFARHIYEAADASLQLQDFYKRVSCPLLHDIKFKYDAEVKEVTKTWFPIYFRGSELVVSGRFGGPIFPTVIDCWGPYGLISVNSTVERPVTSLERMWAYLTVKQLLDSRESDPNPADLTRKAVDLALKYSFVTDVTSLVVVKPKQNAPNFGDYDTRIPVIFGVPPAPYQQPYVRPHAGLFGTPSVQSNFGRPMATPGQFGAPPSSQLSFGSSNAAVFGSAFQPQFQNKQLASIFGTTSVATTGQFGAIGMPPPPPPTFGVQGTTATASAPFAQSVATTGLFGATTPTTGIFGATSPTTGIFGATSQPPPPPPPTFGGIQATSGIFGTPGATTEFWASRRKILETILKSPSPPTFGGITFGEIQGTQTTEISAAPMPGSGATSGIFGSPSVPPPIFGSNQGRESTGSGFTFFPQGQDQGQASTFTFGCPQTTTTSSGAQGNIPAANQSVDSNLFPDAKSRGASKSVTESAKEFKVNRPFIVMLQLEKDDTVLILCHGHVYRPSY